MVKKVEGIRAAGIVVFRDSPREYLLLLKKGKDAAEFPKGKVERGEKAQQAALREVREETGITQVEILPGYQREFTYRFRKEDLMIERKAIYFLGRTDARDVRVGHEHKGFVWLAPKAAIVKLRFKNQKLLIRKAEEFLAKGGPPNIL